MFGVFFGGVEATSVKGPAGSKPHAATRIFCKMGMVQSKKLKFAVHLIVLLSGQQIYIRV